jgi:peptidoglycan L-alanyl-D-glutamate endopeptidase CwlK
MPQFSQQSLDRLATCDHHLQILFCEVVKHWDCTVTEGHRSPERQIELFNSGKSKVQRGKHNETPSLAVDVAPCVDGKPVYDTRICYSFGGFVMGIAACLNLRDRIRWGGDWDNDRDVTDQTFNDLVHFEMR